jgi:hypothetical protein
MKAPLKWLVLQFYYCIAVPTHTTYTSIKKINKHCIIHSNIILLTARGTYFQNLYTPSLEQLQNGINNLIEISQQI